MMFSIYPYLCKLDIKVWYMSGDSQRSEVHVHVTLAKPCRENPRFSGISRRALKTKHDKYEPRIKRDGHYLYLGLFDTPEEALTARAIAASLYDNKRNGCLDFKSGLYYCPDDVPVEDAGYFTIPPLTENLDGVEKAQLVVRTTKEVHEKFKSEKQLAEITQLEEIASWLETDGMVPGSATDQTAPPGSADGVVKTADQGFVLDSSTSDPVTDHRPAWPLSDLQYASLAAYMEDAFSGGDPGTAEELPAGSPTLSPELLDSPTDNRITAIQADQAGSHEQENRLLWQLVNNLMRGQQRLSQRVTNLEQALKGLLQCDRDQNSEAPQKRKILELQCDANIDHRPSSPQTKRTRKTGDHVWQPC